MRTYVLWSMILAARLPQAASAQSLPPYSFRAGAAKVDVTPSEIELPKNWHGILDRLYSRAIVLDNGASRAALITVDDGGVSDMTWRTVTQRVEKELGIPTSNVFLTATHTHSALRQRGPDYPQKIFESVKLAQRNLAPARLGYGTGVSYINVNRNMIDAKTRRWWEEPNYDGPSDKTVAVVKIESLSGQPIAVYYNYAVHPVLVGQLDMISADIPGTVSRYIEDSLDDKIIAVWSSGASGELCQARNRHQQLHAAWRRGPKQERCNRRQAHEPAKADGFIHGAISGRSGASRDAGRGPHGGLYADLRKPENGSVSGPRTDEYGTRR